jgi:hypothetical protein
MSFVKTFFGKDMSDLSVDDLTGFFSQPQEESNKMEFKSFEVHPKGKNDLADRENAIMRVICGFLNSEGGMLIWGAPVEMKANGKSLYIGDLTPGDKEYPKDQFIAKIANTIIPSPQGILFRSFAYRGGFLYLFDVPRSEYSPHQYSDKYYMRMDGQTKAAPHHYIEALFKKVSFPNLEAYLKIEDYGPWKSGQFYLKCSVLFRNQTPYQNDFDLHYRVFSSHGYIMAFLSNVNENINEEILKRPGDYGNMVASTIYYGNWVDSRFAILLSESELKERNFNLSIRLQFGARHSPMKICLYDLIMVDGLKDKLQDHIIKMTENRFFNIHEESMGKPDLQRLKEALGR